MFESVVANPDWDLGDYVPDDGLDESLERMLAETDAAAVGDPGWVAGAPPSGRPPADANEPVFAYGRCAPSGWLALDLDAATADPTALDDHTLIEAIIGFDRITSWAQARQARLLAELARRRPTDTAPHSARWAGMGSEYAPDEAGVALRLSRGAACARIGLACRLLAVLPDTHALWEAGQIDTSKARAIDDATWMLAPDHAQAVQDRVLPKAPTQTLAQLKAALARAVLAADPAVAEQRHREARRDRRVVITPEPDGMASLWALLTATQAAGAFTWLTRLARSLGPDDPRSMDSRRADLLAALLTGSLVLNTDTTPTADPDSIERSGSVAHPGATAPEPARPTPAADASTAGAATAGRPIQPVTPGKPLIQIVMSHSTLIGADDQPAELAGHGPIPAGLARDVAADAVWRRLITDPLSGTLLDYGRTTYHPPAGLGDHIRARDLYCRAPGCRRPAADAELDHVIAWSDGGTTSEHNLAGYCPHDHRVKTYAGWQVQAHPDGSLTWTTPTGHQHTTMPHDYRPEPPAPPPAPEPTSTRPPEPDPDPPPF